jgi:transposase
MSATTTFFGCDLGDKKSFVCVLNAAGDVVERFVVATTPSAFADEFSRRCRGRCVIAIETGTHSPWASRVLKNSGFEVCVANSRDLKLISGSKDKSDEADAERLARLVRADPRLLRPVQHRSEDAQKQLVLLRSRKTLVQIRTKSVNAVRNTLKSLGLRIRKCDTVHFVTHAAATAGNDYAPLVDALLRTISAVNAEIAKLDKRIDAMACDDVAVSAMTQIVGVGAVTALTFRYIIDDPKRFAKSRDVGPYLGLTSRRAQSGSSDPELGISKCGDPYMRTLLVNCAQQILQKNAADSDLRRHGLHIAAASKTKKKKAVIAVARKLAVLMHRLWVTGEEYRPLHNAEKATQAEAA